VGFQKKSGKKKTGTHESTTQTGGARHLGAKAHSRNPQYSRNSVKRGLLGGKRPSERTYDQHGFNIPDDHQGRGTNHVPVMGSQFGVTGLSQDYQNLPNEGQGEL